MGKAWVSFESLKNVFGSKETYQRVFLQTCAPAVKEVGADGVEKFNDLAEFSQDFEKAKSYVYLGLTLSKAVVPFPP